MSLDEEFPKYLFRTYAKEVQSDAFRRDFAAHRSRLNASL